jgi:5-methylthioadenosine/S-adenosylhomocysteine deaminase
MRKVRTRVARSAFLLLMLAWPLYPTVTMTAGTAPGRYVLRGTIVTPGEVISTGEVVIQGDSIDCVAQDCPDPPGATIFTITNAYILPGFVDAHNHVAYNFLPKWNPPQQYQNRYQWQRTTSYKEFKKPYAELKEQGLACEMIKYGEIKALLSGVTTIQGTSPGSKCVQTLIRNAENQNELGLPGAHIRTFILAIKSFQGAVDFTETKSFLPHVAEGIDPDSRAEFATLKAKGLLTAQTAIIHGTAFEAAEFEEMGKVGAKLIWSPRSNMVLYGKTTNIKLALQHQVAVSLGVDWNPSGSDNIFDELRVAAQINEDQFGSAIQDADWIKMITENPAKALALDGLLGRLAKGQRADIVVLRNRDDVLGQSLRKNELSDVQMVWVGGELLYGDESVVEGARPGACEALQVNGAQKRVCVQDTTNPVPKSDQTLDQIQNALRNAYPGLAPLVP